eukprot:scaffold651083_cov47-Prasinocladus_malaysianus.AAC.1
MNHLAQGSLSKVPYLPVYIQNRAIVGFHNDQFNPQQPPPMNPEVQALLAATPTYNMVESASSDPRSHPMARGNLVAPAAHNVLAK